MEGRAPDHFYIADLPNDSGLNDAAAAEQGMKEWDWDPNEVDETQCTTAAWNVLSGGAAPVQREKGTFRPSKMAQRLEERIKKGETWIRRAPVPAYAKPKKKP